jgi:hypothetical protein
MHSAQRYRQRAAQVRRLTESVLDPALLQQLETVANEYDQIADHLERPHSGTAEIGGASATQRDDRQAAPTAPLPIPRRPAPRT